MAHQYLVPGVGYVNETVNKQYLIPGSVYLDETVVTSPTVTIDQWFSQIVDKVRVKNKGISYLIPSNTYLDVIVVTPTSYYRSLTIDHTKCGSNDSSSFPVLVSISHSTFKDVAHGGHVQNSSGYDIIFTSDSGGSTKIPWEVEFYDNVNGVLVAWVNVATVSHTVDTVFYVFYGNSGISSPQNTGSFAPTKVWNILYIAVWHLGNGSTLSGNDSTTTNANLTNNGVTATVGQVDGGANFVAASSQEMTRAGITSTGSMTFEFWMKSTSISTFQGVLYNSTNSTDFMVIATNVSKIYASSMNANIDTLMSNTLSSNTWYHIVVTKTAGLTTNIYINGATQNNAGDGFLSGPTSKTAIGSDWYSGTGSLFFDGIIDEVRISSTVRSADWVLTSYNNQFAPGNIGADNFIKFGTEASIGVSETVTLDKWFVNLVDNLRPKNDIIAY